MRVDYVVVAGNRLITVHGRDNGSVVGREERREKREERERERERN
jgi:Mg2+ and Co2+ transporter CorA